jgi:molecular chaperone GrpE
VSDEDASCDGEVERLRRELEAQTAKTAEYLDLAKRIQADFDNFRKRTVREKEDIVRGASDKVITDLLPLLDDLERALAAKASEDELRKGIKQVQVNLLSLLRSYGLREIPASTRFDPAMHDALCVGDGAEGEILELYQKGYFLGPRVIRHAKVKVGRPKEEKPSEEETEGGMENGEDNRN